MDSNNDEPQNEVIQETTDETEEKVEETEEETEEPIQKTKIRKERKPLTEEQKQKNIENLKKARAKKSEYNRKYRDKQKAIKKEKEEIKKEKKVIIKEKKEIPVEETIDEDLENQKPPPTPKLVRQQPIIEPRYTLAEYKQMHQDAINRKKQRQDLEKQNHINKIIENMQLGGLKC